MAEELPAYPIVVVEERGYNLDYLVVAALGGMVPGFQLRRFEVSAEGRVICRAIGRRALVDWPDQIWAMRFAHAFWDSLRWVLLALWVAPLVILGIIDHTLLGGPMRIYMAVEFGLLIAVFIQVAITFFRRWTTIDQVLTWIDRRGREHQFRRGPMPHDSLLSVGSGVFTVVMFLTGT